MSTSTGTGITQDVDLCILGDEPAAGWFASQLAAAAPTSVVWVRNNPTPRRVLLSAGVASQFGIAAAEPFSLEIVYPEERFLWDDQELKKRFPAASEIIPHTGFSGPVMAQAEKVLRQSPDLLSLAQGIWKATGRCLWPRHSALILNALFSTRLGWWDADAQVPAQFEKWTHPLHEVEDLKLETRGRWLVKLKGRQPLLAHALLLALDGPDLQKLCGRFPSLGPRVAVEFAEILDTRCAYSFELTADPAAIPWPTPPVSLFFESASLPEPLNEIWPVYCRRVEGETQLEAEVIGPSNISLEWLFDRFRLGLGMLYRSYPFLPQGLRHLFPTLDMESCYSAESRIKTAEELTRRRRALYRQTSLEMRTKAGNAFVLAPFTYCHLPYPLGTLQAARDLLRLWPKKKLRPAIPQPTASA